MGSRRRLISQVLELVEEMDEDGLLRLLRFIRHRQSKRAAQDGAANVVQHGHGGTDLGHNRVLKGAVPSLNRQPGTLWLDEDRDAGSQLGRDLDKRVDEELSARTARFPRM